jgi:hypothetical protein
LSGREAAGWEGRPDGRGWQSLGAGGRGEEDLEAKRGGLLPLAGAASDSEKEELEKGDVYYSKARRGR